MDPADTDRRGSHRLCVTIPIRARLLQSSLPERYAELINISQTGAYFATLNRFLEGDLLELSTTITTRSGVLPLEWRYIARVVRVQGLNSRPLAYGVGVQFERDRTPQEKCLITGTSKTSRVAPVQVAINLG